MSAADDIAAVRQPFALAEGMLAGMIEDGREPADSPNMAEAREIIAAARAALSRLAALLPPDDPIRIRELQAVNAQITRHRDELAALLAATEADAKKAWEFEHKMMLRATAAEAREKALREAGERWVAETGPGQHVNTRVGRNMMIRALAASSPEGER